MRNQLDIFDHDPARMAAANRAAADHALHDVQFTEAERQARAAHYPGEAERWESLAAHSARHHRTQGAARMTTDKTPATLATVKHGGCVQLATVPYDRARELIGDAYNAGTHGIGYSQQAMELHDAVITAQPSPAGQGDGLHEAVGRIFGCDGSPWRTRDVAAVLRDYAALSAQASPRGQGDAREQFEEYRGGDCERDAQGYYVNARTAQDWAMWQAALGARQPVGSEEAHVLPPLATERMLDVGWPYGEVIDANFDRQGAYADLVAAAPSAQAVAADGFWLAVDDDGFVHFGQSTDDGNGGVGVRENVESRINDWLDNDGRSVDLVWAGSAPAPVVDLGKSLPLIARVLAEWHEDDGNVLWWAWCGREWAGEPAWCGTPNDSDWPGYHTHWTPHPSQPALLDRQAVGNG